MAQDYQFYEVRDFPLQSGEVLKTARLAYKTWGSLSHARDNVVLFPTWFTSTHRNNAWLIGGGRALDPERYFIVSPNLMGNGLSSSPSNAEPAQRGPRFPQVTALDNVRLQAKFVEEVFGVRTLRLIVGRSMGAQTAFQWGSYYPDHMKGLLALCGSSRTTPHNYVFLEGVKAALTADAAWKGGAYSEQPKAGMRAVGRIYAGWAMSQAFYREGLHKLDGFEGLDEYLQGKWDNNFAHMDANDLMAMIGTWQTMDVSNNERFNGNWELALRAITCRAIVMPSRTDLYFPPEDSAAAVRFMPNAELRVIDSIWGHRAGAPNSDPKDIAFVEKAIADLLEATAR